MGTQEQANGKQTTRLESLANSTQAVPSYSTNRFSQEGAFVGREHELETIEQRLKDPNCRLLTLTGLGGIGKTRIAAEAGERLAHDFAHGSTFIPLAPIASEGLIVPALAAALGYLFHGGEPPQAQLIQFLRNREALLVLDNFEHVMEGVELIAEIVQGAPGVRLLVTSRERLNLREEWVLDVQGLTYPKDDASSDVEVYSAVQLFLQCARRAKADFALTKQNQPDVIRICRLVEGVPLGIELAAAWVSVLSCKAIGDEIERTLDFLTARVRNAPDKHRSMRAVFSHSYDLLTPEQQQAFNRLSIFRGGFTREAAGHIAGALLETLGALVDKSLLRLNADSRYDMHELLRQYGGDQLDASGAGNSTRDAHSAYFADFLHQRVEDLKGRRQIEAMAEFRADFENVRAAWYWAAGHQRADLIEQMIEGLWVACDLLGRDHERSALFQDAQQQFAPGRSEESQRIWGRVTARTALVNVSQTQLETALQIAQRHDDLAEVAFCLKRLGITAYARGEYDREMQLLEQSLTIYRQLEDRYAMAEVLLTLMSFSHERTWDDFKRYGEESLRLSREIGDRVGATQSLAAVALDAGRSGRFAEAERLWLERVELGHEIGNLQLIALGKAHVSHKVYFFQGDFVRARAAAEEALKLGTTVGHAHAVGWALATLGLLACMDENYPEGMRLCDQGASAGDLVSIAGLAAWGQSIASCGLEDYDAASEFLSSAFKFLSLILGSVGIVGSLAVAAIISAHRGDPVRAVEWLGLAFTHPIGASGWMERWPLLRRVCAELEQAFGDEAFSAVWERGKRLDIGEAAAELRARFPAERAGPEGKTGSSLVEPLTAREFDVLRLIADGLSNRDIADRLILSEGTVKWYTTQIYGKLGVQNRAQAVQRSHELNLLV